MSILGYSSAYFLPQYWANTPLYGEKIIPLLDYVLSTDYQHTSKLASAFYDIENKYKSTGNLPIDKIEAIIEESGYGYIRELLGQDEDSLRLLVYILVLVHELKGSKRGVQTVLELLRMKEDALELRIAGTPTIVPPKDVKDFSESNYVFYSNFRVDDDTFELTFKIKTGSSFSTEQCIASSPDYGFYLGIDEAGAIVLKVGESTNNGRVWQLLNNSVVNKSESKLKTSTEYTIKFIFSGYDYTVDVTENGNTSNYLSLDSSTGLGIVGGSIFLGIDSSTSTLKNPFQGSISIDMFSLIANSIQITQWFETFPVEEEDTFTVDATLDVNVISEDFFIKFAKFIERYVYPTLRVFRVRMSLKGKLTFLPYVRQKVNYIASNISSGGYENFTVKKENSSGRELYGVQVPLLYAWSFNDNFVYTKDVEIHAATSLFNKDMTTYTGSEFKVTEYTRKGLIAYHITYNGETADRNEEHDIYGPTPFQTRE